MIGQNMVWKPLTRLARTALICRVLTRLWMALTSSKRTILSLRCCRKKAHCCVEKMQHSYPCCWRHKTPIIFRATPQWFVSMDQERSACAVTERDQRRAVDP
ncbi:hypothetical protein DMI70_19870 [Escherichia coli]|nr:hypothetical protein [Escherichia coli]